ncbi:hypothetical protein BDY19DRAFT_925648 [Irpex rosettiformis]|uniref:Uncharacterized protein n=1 Tax=Irpex rosettiformis TaxID=378272 RepID=A0ACB8UG98_9APHY|nr:hypothetical protein BDY19DRAFT_925648 [Irpex rosettiformis]
MPTTVILGTGIIGLSTAYYLSRFAEDEATEGSQTEKHEIHLVEATPELFASASGKAAGFLAKDWFQPAVAPLGEFSFGLHRKLAEEHDGRSKWGWSESTSYSLDRDDDEDDEDEEGEPGELSARHSPNSPSNENIADAGETARPSRSGRSRKSDLDWLMSGSSRSTLLDNPIVNSQDKGDLPRWLHARRSSLQPISDRATTGQVDPYRLCQFLLQESSARGVKLHYPARASQLQHMDPNDPSSKTSLRLEFLDSDPKPISELEARSSPNSLSPPAVPRDAPFPLLAVDGAISDGNPTLSYRTNPRTLDIPCDSIVIAAGCWTPRVYRALFPNAGRIPRVTALAGHSIQLRSKHWPPIPPGDLRTVTQDAAKIGGAASDTASGPADVSSDFSPPTDTANHVASLTSPKPSGAIDSPPVPTTRRDPEQNSSGVQTALVPKLHSCHAVFTNDPAGYSPEIFSRLSGDIWLGGYNTSSIPLPPLATQATPHPSSINVLINTGKALCGQDVEIIRGGLCFRPVAPTGRPVIAKVHEADLGDGVRVGGGVFVATGHGPWGISLSLGTGHVVGEMVLGREPSVDVKSLSVWEAQAV